MHLRSLELTNYRNFRRLSLKLDDGPTVVQGRNAQGKTNLLEAIELLATTKAARSGTDRELINWSVLEGEATALLPVEPFARISAVVTRESGDIRVDVLLRIAEASENGQGPSVSKSFRLNGLPRRALEFVGAINVVSFSPEDVALVAGAPSVRRRYLDVTHAQMNPRYLRTLQRYNKVLLQRNHLLRAVREQGGRSESSLGAWDQELANAGAYLMQERARGVGALHFSANRWFRELGGWGQRLDIRYRPSCCDPECVVARTTDGEESSGHIHGAFMAELTRVAGRERAAGMSLIGPHRDDLGFFVDDVDLNVYGSRGQQRLAALSLKLAEVDVLTERVGSRPILLLDDVLSELDDQKQGAILRVAATSGQTLLTLTEVGAAQRQRLGNAALFHMSGGMLTSEGLLSEDASVQIPNGTVLQGSPPE